MRRLRRIPLLWIVLVLQVVDQITVETGHVLALLVVVQIIVDKNNKRRYSCIILNSKNMEQSLIGFEKELRRFEATNEFHNAFKLCLDNMKNPLLHKSAYDYAMNLIKEQGCKVMELDGSNYHFVVSKKLDSNWLLDIAIQLGYKNIERTSYSVGFFTKVPAIALGGFFTKQYFGMGSDKEHNTIIYYCNGRFGTDTKMIQKVCEEIVNLYK